MGLCKARWRSIKTNWCGQLRLSGMPEAIEEGELDELVSGRLHASRTAGGYLRGV